MRTYILEREQWLPKAVDEVFSFFSRPENLPAITPSWLDFRMVEAPVALAVESLIHYRLRWHGVPIRWTTEISEWNPPHRFVDRSVSGPYAVESRALVCGAGRRDDDARSGQVRAAFGLGRQCGSLDAGEARHGAAF